MANTTSGASAPLTKAISGPAFFTLAFGTTVGSAWVILLGVWLKAAGPGGAAIGFLGGTIFMLMVSAYFGELACRMPVAGGEATYAGLVLGPSAGKLVGWFLLLFVTSFCAFEGLALASLLETLIPAITGPELYRVGETPVTAGATLVGTVGALTIGWLNMQRVSVTVWVQKIITFTFIAASILLMLAGFALGNGANAEPLFASGEPGGSWVLGASWIFATSATFLTGFQAALHVIEERAPHLTARDVVLRMMAGVAAAGAFYILLIMSAARAAPWRTIITRELPAAEAFGSLPGAGVLRTVVLVVAIVSLFKAWNALTLMASRMVVARAREGMMPAALARLAPGSEAPRAAVALITVVTVIGVLVGRAAIVPILNTASVSITLIYVLMMVVLVRLRRSGDARLAFRVPGGWLPIAITGAGLTVMAGIALLEPMFLARSVPVEWPILLCWLGAGAILVRRSGATAAQPGASGSQA